MKEWYLIGNETKPNMIGGYENESFLDFKEDAFGDALTTDIADTVILCNYDLSQTSEIRGIIQGNTADSSVKSMERTILVPIGTLHSGDYIFFEDEYWIVDGRPSNNKIYEKATLKECQYKLRWQKSDGTIVERWANLSSVSSSIGEERNNTFVLTSNNYAIIIPHDNDSMTIENKRVFIDTSDIPAKVYKITRNDDALYLHGTHGGTLYLVADKVELNTSTDNPKLRICDYITSNSGTLPLAQPPLSKTVLTASISGNKNLKLGIPRTYTATLVDENGNTVDWDDNLFTWQITSDFIVEQNTMGNRIELYVEKKNDISKSFLLQVIKILEKSVISEIEITVACVI